jgi:hypothetical protein
VFQRKYPLNMKQLVALFPLFPPLLHAFICEMKSEINLTWPIIARATPALTFAIPDFSQPLTRRTLV